MTKTIYLVYDVPSAGTGDWYQSKPTYHKFEAIRNARIAWEYLTEHEKSKRYVYVGAHTVSVPEDDVRAASRVYKDMMDDDTWPADHDVITIQ